MTPSTFQQRYDNPGLCFVVKGKKCLVETPKPGVHAPQKYTPPKALPAQAQINIDRYPAVGDQGPLGACAAWAGAWAASYEWRMLHPKSTLKYSARYGYLHYSNTYANGQDAGSWPDQDLETLPTTGIPRFAQLPYPPYTMGAIPDTDTHGNSLAADAARYRMPIQIHPLTGFSFGAGQAAVDLVRSVISGQGSVDGKSHPVLIALPVYPEYDNATAQPLITSPQPGEYSRGGHSNVILAYDDTKQFPDGTVGGVLVQNQWSTRWGIEGRAWLSYDFLRNWSFGLEYITVGGTTSAPQPPHHPVVKPSKAPKGGADGGKAPFLPKTQPKPDVKTVGTPNGWYVSPYYTRDSHTNISPLINAAGDRYGIWPVYVLAVVMAESGGNQYAARWGVWPDVSFGLMQVTTSTLTGYYSGCGYDNYCAQRYLNDANTSVYLGARILSDYKAMTGVGYPALWECYNAGPGSCNSPYYAGFLPPPKKKHFPAKKWRAFTHKVPYRVGGKFRVEALLWWHGHVGSAGGAVSVPQYVKRHHHSYMTMRFQNERVWWWLGTHWVKWSRVYHIPR
jgi:hypothetical protein